MIVLCRGNDHSVLARKIMTRLRSVGADVELFKQDRDQTLLIRRIGRNSCIAKLELDEQNFALYSGMFCYRCRTGSDALRDLINDFSEGIPLLSETRGQFVLFIRKTGKDYFLNDSLGVNKIYVSHDLTVLSDRFIAVAEGVESLTIDKQGVYEYAWNGASFAENTFFCEIRTVPFGNGVAVSDGCRLFPTAQAQPFQIEAEVGDADEIVDIHVRRATDLIRTYVTCFGNDINLSLSGGYDSRLLLALLLNIGIKPRIFVYGTERDIECSIVKAIAKGQGLEFELVDKSHHPKIPVKEYSRHIAQNYGLFDGWKNGGLFDNGADGPDRRQRVRNGYIKVNGSVGEIYRNFFYLHDRTYHVREIAWSFYARYSPKACTSQFDPKGYERSIADAIKKSLGVTKDRLARREVELVYPLFRARYWTARDVPINQNFGPCLFPYLEPAVISGTCDIPLALKSYGIFEGRMIRHLNQNVAGHPSIYGFSFSHDPPRSYRLRSQLTYWRPPWLRRYAYRLRFHWPQPRPYYLENAYLEAVLRDRFPFMNSYFRIDEINDPDVLNRVATIEYICQRTGARQD